MRLDCRQKRDLGNVIKERIHGGDADRLRHPSAVGGTRTTLLPYLDDHWKEQVVSRAIDGLDLTSYPPNMPLSGRADWRPANGKKPGSDLAMVQRGAFDQLGASHAHLQRAIWRPGCLRPLYGRGFLQGDQRLDRGGVARKGFPLRASIVVPLQAPDLAIEEIERRAGDNRFRFDPGVGTGRKPARTTALLAGMQLAERYQLPIAIHAGSQYRSAPSSVGLAVLSLRILSRRGAGLSGPGAQPGL